MVDLLGVGDLSPSNEDDMGLREANRLDRNVPFALSSVPATNAVAPTRRTRLRFMSSRRRGGHNATRQSPLRSPIQEAVPDHLEHRFADVISVVEALQEEKDSAENCHEDAAALPCRDSVPPSQQDSVPPPQQDSTTVHGTKASFQQGTTALPRKDAVPPPLQQDNIVGISDVEQSQQDTSCASAVGEQSQQDTVTTTSDQPADPRLQVG
ncbi:hypothetical protein Q3G72_015118 [Acer saccharum]|nr:hypothetical protein Q3G72_015118 [Acer saccharum]